ncbi:MAG: FixH family protein [Deltaproteobacteria bacterium]|nr:FixH family protein [Deltaproteobacteria bacterium]
MRTIRWMLMAVLAACTDGGDGSTAGFDETKTGDHGLYAFHLTSADVPQQGSNTFTLELTASGSPVDGATVTVDALMPAHGHGSGTPITVSAAGNGRYTVGNVSFTMAGAWDLTCSASRAASQDSATFHLDVP